MFTLKDELGCLYAHEVTVQCQNYPAELVVEMSVILFVFHFGMLMLH